MGRAGRQGVGERASRHQAVMMRGAGRRADWDSTKGGHRGPCVILELTLTINLTRGPCVILELTLTINLTRGPCVVLELTLTINLTRGPCVILECVECVK